MYRHHRHVVATVVLCLLGVSLAACGASTTGSAGRAQATQRAAGSNASPATTAAGNADATTPPTSEAADAADADDNEGDESNAVAQRIADEFKVPVSEVEGYHDQDIGYGVLAQLYAIANGRCGGQSQYTVQQLVELHNNGTGMGDIRKQALGAAAARDCTLGGLKQQELDDADANNQHQGQGKGKGKDK